MKKIDYIHTFRDFLILHHVKDKFLAACQSQHPERFVSFTDDNYSNFLMRCPPEDFIFGAFVWSNAKEGLRYWLKLDEMWCYYLKIKIDY